MYLKVVVPANGLKVYHNDFVAFHSIWRIFERVKVFYFEWNIIHISSEVPQNCYDLPSTHSQAPPPCDTH